MKHKKVINIDSLEKYISQIKKIMPSYYFRGESKIYPERIASAFRSCKNGKDGWNSKKPFPFMQMINEFYKEIAYKLDEDRADFIAFAQHYGIPTNLIDITTSPLIALYFAVEKDFDDTGIVYVMDDCYIDVTDLIHSYPKANIIEELFSNTPKELNTLAPLFEQFKSDFPNEFYALLKQLISDYLAYFDYPFNKNEKELQKELKKKKGFDSCLCYLLLGELIDNLKDFSLENIDMDVCLYLALLFYFLKKAREVQEPIWSIDFLPNLIYRPVITFERGRNQHGLFLSQAYITYIEPVYNFRVLAKQSVTFQPIEFHITNKQEILNDLDRIGINKKTIFCDFDNTAAYIKEKYSIIKDSELLN